MPFTPASERSYLSLRAAVALGAAGLLAGALTGWAASMSSTVVTPHAVAILRGCLVAGYVVAGAYAWHRRAGDRFAPLLVLLGFGHAVTTLIASEDATVYASGRLVTAAWVGLYLYAFLTFPAGRPTTRVERWIVEAYAVGALVLWPLVVILAPKLPVAGALTDCGNRCPDNGLRVATVSETVWRGPYVAVSLVTAVVAVAAAVVVARKAWSPRAVERRTVAPVLIAACAVFLSYVAFSVHPVGGTWHTVNLVVAGVAALFAPIAFVLGPLRGEQFVSGSLWRSLSGVDYSRLSPARAEEICRRALGDSTLRLAVLAPGAGSFRDVGGAEIAVPDGDGRDGKAGGATVTRFERDGVTYALIHHHSLGNGYRWLVERVGGLACTLTEYGRLFHDVVFSRRRIAETEGQDRMQLERDLHDGAQQRLLAMRMKLAELEKRVAGSELATPVGELSRDAASAVDEVRRIAKGIYPPLLLERGVADALRELPKPPGLRVEVVDNGVPRLSAPTERALYFTAVEAIQNATKHAGATSVLVTVEPLGDLVELVVEDDGVGFETQTAVRGNGLVGMYDRIGSAGGEITITSATTGTIVRCLVPVDPALVEA